MRGGARLLSLALAAGLSLGAPEALVGCAGAGDPNGGGSPEAAQAQPPDTHPPDTQAPDTQAPDTHPPDTQAPDPQAPSDPTPSAAAAGDLSAEGLLRALRARWAELSASRHAALPSRAQIDGLLASPAAPPRLLRRACAELHRGLVERAGPDLGRSSQGAYVILDGSGEALRDGGSGSGGECRLLLVDGMMGPSLEAAFGPDGRLLFLWMIAEG